MNGTGAYLSALMDYWGRIGKGAVQRFGKASQEIKDRQYGTEKMVSDMLGLWVEGVDSWWAALRGGGADLSPPSVFFKVTPKVTQSKNASVTVSVPGSGPPKWTAIQPMGGDPDDGIPLDHVKVKVKPARDGLDIFLDSLEELRLREGQYQGLVYIDELPLAKIHVLVSR